MEEKIILQSKLKEIHTFLNAINISGQQNIFAMAEAMIRLSNVIDELEREKIEFEQEKQLNAQKPDAKLKK